MSNQDDLMDQIDKSFDIDREEIDIDKEKLNKRIEESPDGSIKAEMEAASEIWGERINKEDDTIELEFHKERVDGMLEHLDELQDSVSDLQDVVERDDEV